MPVLISSVPARMARAVVSNSGRAAASRSISARSPGSAAASRQRASCWGTYRTSPGPVHTHGRSGRRWHHRGHAACRVRPRHWPASPWHRPGRHRSCSWTWAAWRAAARGPTRGTGGQKTGSPSVNPRSGFARPPVDARSLHFRVAVGRLEGPCPGRFPRRRYPFIRRVRRQYCAPSRSPASLAAPCLWLLFVRSAIDTRQRAGQSDPMRIAARVLGMGLSRTATSRRPGSSRGPPAAVCVREPSLHRPIQVRSRSGAHIRDQCARTLNLSLSLRWTADFWAHVLLLRGMERGPDSRGGDAVAATNPCQSRVLCNTYIYTSCNRRWPRFQDTTRSSGSRLQRKGRASWTL